MDFELSPELKELRRRVRELVDERVIPVEERVLAEYAAGERNTLHALQAEAQAAGLWTPHLPEAYGGRGLGVMGACALFREMGRSPIGARVFNCDAPDQPNMDLLLRVGSEAIRAKYLAPLCAGHITSAFCLTEPAPGAGSDPSELRTTARLDGGEWVLDGHKWFSTGGGHAAFLIVVARTSRDPRDGTTIFVVDRDAPGVEHVRDVAVMAPDVLHHAAGEFRFRGVRVPDRGVLGGVGEGSVLLRKRLVPARLAQCARWLGLADRTLSMCRPYITQRSSRGRRLAEHQQIQAMLAHNAAAIHAGNLMTCHGAWLLAREGEGAALAYASMAKNQVARLLCKVTDDAIQMHGALGYSDDRPFARWYRTARAARIADGPDEAHTTLVARELLRGRLELLV